jgi:hypothetical protein
MVKTMLSTLMTIMIVALTARPLFLQTPPGADLELASLRP